VDLVEKDRRLVRLIEEQTRSWQGIDKVRFIGADVLQWMATRPGSYDLVFIDPPFDQSLHQSVLDGLTEHGILKPESLVYVECDAGSDPVGKAEHSFRVVREKRQGGVMLRLLQV
jgi:16S rRNA (guanine966-N2)-methyltransferase